MKTLLAALFTLCMALGLSAQTQTETPQKVRTPEELERLLSPIALYPDSLVAVILPAATEPSDIVLANRLVSSNASAEMIATQDWEESVKILARYPTVLAWLDANLLWTREVGEAYLSQPTDVMNAIQRLRANARAAGLLVDTPEQRVIVEDDVIYLTPTSDEIIYIPSYDPEILYLHRPWHGPFLSFSIGFRLGLWMRYDCDWHRHTVWVHDRDQRRDYRYDWRRPDHPDHDRITGRSWTPNPGHLYSRDHRPQDFVFNRPSFTYGRDREDHRYQTPTRPPMQERPRDDNARPAQPPRDHPVVSNPGVNRPWDRQPSAQAANPNNGRNDHNPVQYRRDSVADNERFHRVDTPKQDNAQASNGTPRSEPRKVIQPRNDNPRAERPHSDPSDKKQERKDNDR